MSLLRRSVQILYREGPLVFLMTALRFTYRKLRIEFVILYLTRELISLLNRDENLWVLGDGHRGRDRRGHNAKYFFLQLAERDETPRMVWVSRHPSEVKTLRSNGYTAYNSRSWRGKISLLRAGKIFCTNGMDFTWWLTGGADIVQLWHGVGLKKSGWDLIDHRGDYSGYKRFYRAQITYNWTYFVTTSRNPPSDIQRRAFGVKEQDTLVTGLPRTDLFFDDIDHLGLDVDIKLIDYLEGLSAEETVFVYAPTWRRDYESDQTPISESDIDLSHIQNILEKTKGYLVLKLHPKTIIPEEITAHNRILLADPHCDPYPVLARADCLITDYSSLYIDYLLLNRPIIFFPYDLGEYESSEGLCYTYESLSPGDIAREPRELYESLCAVANGRDTYSTERRVIRDLFHDYVDGNSAERLYRELV